MAITYTPLGPPPEEGEELVAVLESIDGLDQPLESQYGDILRFTFRPVDEDYSNRAITKVTSTAANEYSELGKTVTALLDRELVKGEDLEVAIGEMIGTKYLVTVTHDEAEHGGTYLRADSIQRCSENS